MDCLKLPVSSDKNSPKIPAFNISAFKRMRKQEKMSVVASYLMQFDSVYKANLYAALLNSMESGHTAIPGPSGISFSEYRKHVHRFIKQYEEAKHKEQNEKS